MIKDKSFNIKIGDLLQETGRKDDLKFQKKWSEKVPGLTEDGISGTIFLQSLSNDSVYADLEDISCDIDSECDTCGQYFKRPVHIEEYSAKYVLGEAAIKLEQEHSEEEIFPISGRDETIDIEELIVQAIRLDEPIVIHCPDCAKTLESTEDEDDSDYLEGNGNISFH